MFAIKVNTVEVDATTPVVKLTTMASIVDAMVAQITASIKGGQQDRLTMLAIRKERNTWGPALCTELEKRVMASLGGQFSEETVYPILDKITG
jgi:hypothetical protein